jgi:hypothetical protein
MIRGTEERPAGQVVVTPGALQSLAVSGIGALGILDRRLS